MTLPAQIEIEARAEGVRLVRLNRPARLNAFTREMVAEFNSTIEAIAADASCRVVILTGAGRGFCSGQDVAAADARNRHAPSDLVEKLFWQEQFAGMSRRLMRMPQVVIAAVNGPAAGAGMAITLASDIRIAAESARFLVAAIRIGLTAGESGISYFLPRLIGASRAFEIMLTGRPVDALEAAQIGLVSRFVADDELIPSAEALAASIQANSPFAVRHTKRLMWENLEAPSFENAIELENRRRCWRP